MMISNAVYQAEFVLAADILENFFTSDGGNTHLAVILFSFGPSCPTPPKN
jgi:hypothetical protein